MRDAEQASKAYNFVLRAAAAWAAIVVPEWAAENPAAALDFEKLRRAGAVAIDVCVLDILGATPTIELRVMHGDESIAVLHQPGRSLARAGAQVHG